MRTALFPVGPVGSDDDLDTIPAPPPDFAPTMPILPRDDEPSWASEDA